jgi:hypothetical protein
MQENVRKEVIHLLDADIIYHVKESDWVSLVHCVTKTGGFTFEPNENLELIRVIAIVGYTMCINLRKLNK